MSTLFDNLRIAFRDLRHRTVFTATVVLTLTIGIGATTAAFALVDAVFLTRLPVRDQDRLVSMFASDKPDEVPFIPWDVQGQLRERNGAFAGAAAYWVGVDPYAARYRDRMLHLTRVPVSGPFFDVLGVQPTVGRLIHPSDDVIGAPDVVVLGDRLWHREFGGDPHVIGQMLFFDGTPYRIIGVAPPEFWFPGTTEAWIPLVPYMPRLGLPLEKVWTPLVGRLNPGVTRRAARAELQYALRADLATGKYGPQNNIYRSDLRTTGVVDGYADAVLGSEVRPGVMVLFAAVVLVLVIGCTNVAGLLLARGITRAPDFAVRAALGASRRQLLLYVLTESGLLGLMGGVLGVALGATLVRTATALAPPELPMIGTAHLDLRVLAFTGLIIVGSVIGFGLAPALSESRLDSHQVLRTGSRSMTRGPVIGLARRGLVAVQVALALVILCGAGVLARAMYQLRHVSLGFDPGHLLFFKVDAVVPGSIAHGMRSSSARFNALRDRIVQDFPVIPGLGKVSTALTRPFNGTPTAPYTVDGRLPTKDVPGRPLRFEEALDDYFGVVGVPLLRGRGFSPHDDRGAPTVVVVSQSLAREAWPGQDPVGHRIRIDGDSVDRFWTVVGVAADDRFTALDSAPRPTGYFPARQEAWFDPWFVVRTQGDPDVALKLVDRTIVGMDPMFAVRLSSTGPDVLRQRLARPRALSAVFSALAAAALLLAALGLFGVLSAYVRERRREMAIRSALGATPIQLRSLVLTQTLVVAAIGMACGAPLALVGPHLLHKAVSDVGSVDAVTVLAVALLLLAVVALATYSPMVRASRVDARTALAAE